MIPETASRGKETPGWVWVVTGLVAFTVTVPAATGLLLVSSGSGGPSPAFALARFLILLSFEYYALVFLLLVPQMTGGGLGVVVALLLWPLALFAVSLVLGFRGKEKLAGYLAIATGLLFLPSGVLNVFGGLAYLREAKRPRSPANLFGGPTAGAPP